MSDYTCIECRVMPIVSVVDDFGIRHETFFCAECAVVVEERRRVSEMSFAAWWDEFVV